MAHRPFSRALRPVLLTLVALGAAAPAPAAPAPDDPYLAGYAGAVLEREFKVPRRAVTVQNGVLTLDAAQLAGADRARVLATMATLPGVARVEVREPPAAPAVSPEAAPAAVSALPTGLLPVGHLFQPLLADPRWPHFAASYRYYLDNQDLTHVGAVSFGETIPLFRGNSFSDSQWEAGIQAGVFALFQMDAPSKDLINADYFAALYGAWRRGPLSALGRVFHQSSHLGDEFLIDNRVERVNLSYEAADLRLSYEVTDWLRLYGCGGARLDASRTRRWIASGPISTTLASRRTRCAAYALIAM